MRLALARIPAGDTLKVAVLAALNIADEYFRARDDSSAVTDDSPTAPGSSNACSTWPSGSTEPQAAARYGLADRVICLDWQPRLNVRFDAGVPFPALFRDGSEARLSQCFNLRESRRRVVCMPL